MVDIVVYALYKQLDAAISAYELGKNDVKLGILKEMAPLLGTTVAYLADGESYRFSPEVMQIAMMLEGMQNEELRRVAIEQVKILVRAKLEM